MANPNPSHKFKPGNTYGTGRPKREIEQNYLEILKSELTPERWAGIVKKAIGDALKGIPSARTFLADYALGKPAQVLTLESSDTALLAQVLREFQAQGVSAGDAFEAMLRQMQAVQVQEDQ